MLAKIWTHRNPRWFAPLGDGPREAILGGMDRRTDTIAQQADIAGRVQGVGFRPAVYRLATELGLTGRVGNNAAGAFVEVEGPADRVEAFWARLRRELPPLAEIAELRVTERSPRGRAAFAIDASEHAGAATAEIAPDVATCSDCLAELNDPADRRYRYPFINCTNCGPRYSIVTGVPYDRAQTTMAGFVMCDACRSEYEDPADRRFHAQPNACGACGPRLWVAEADGAELDADPIEAAAETLAGGGIVAVKGLGGFHLAVAADDEQAVRRLRQRKGREAKPLAVMAPDLPAAERLVVLDDAARAALTAPARPIVLAPARSDAPVAASVAPATAGLGVMLPYTPLHHLLLKAFGRAVVMTSGNPTAEPLCIDNAEALARLGGVADRFLLHDRPIARGVDDSVVRVLSDGRRTRVVPIRRARGHVPEPIRLPGPAAPRPVLAVGGGLKSTVCFLDGDRAMVSEHLGELHNPSAYRNFVAAIGRLGELLEITPQKVACDLHPQYPATAYARTLGLPCQPVQHHHAHLVGCLAENGAGGRAVGIAADGTGLGTDGTIWGGEVLVFDETGFARFAHLDTYPLPGGDAAAEQTWRPAGGLLHETFGDAWPDRAGEAFAGVPNQAVDLLARRLAGGAGPRTSSTGRLFDTAAFLLGIAEANPFEAAAAMALEAAAENAPHAPPLPYEVIRPPQGPVRLDWRPTVGAMLAGACEEPAERDRLARAFHETLAAMFAEAAIEAAAAEGLDRVVLAGGCFANAVLTASLAERLDRAGLDVILHRRMPTGDGGLSLGQAVVAARLDPGA